MLWRPQGCATSHNAALTVGASRTTKTTPQRPKTAAPARKVSASAEMRPHGHTRRVVRAALKNGRTRRARSQLRKSRRPLPRGPRESPQPQMRSVLQKSLLSKKAPRPTVVLPSSPRCRKLRTLSRPRSARTSFRHSLPSAGHNLFKNLLKRAPQAKTMLPEESCSPLASWTSPGTQLPRQLRKTTPTKNLKCHRPERMSSRRSSARSRGKSCSSACRRRQ